MKPETLKAIEFLRQFHPTAPWVLTCINPDKKGIQTSTFSAATADAAAEWIDRYNGHSNCYFSVNPPRGPLSKKAEREDIAQVDYLHVDLDPRIGEDINAERERILGLLRDPRGLPPPTVIVFSGGGYQGFWRLEKPIPINGELRLAEDAKRYNIQIELTLGGDNTHNIDRIMRIPGTMNIPDERKRRKGRVPTLAEVLEFHEDRVYPIERFAKSPELQTSDDSGFSGSKISVSGNIQRLNDVDELGEAVSNRVKMIIVQGNDPDEPNKFGSSRSEWLFYVCVNLVKAGIKDDVIYSIITDPNFQISESVLDKKRPEKYAIRQIERAHEEAVHPRLRELNEKHAVIGDLGGKCRVISEVFDPAMKRTKISRQSFEDFRNRYGHIQIEVGVGPNGPIVKKLGHWWLENAQHRHYETIVFSPGGDVEGSYNLWKGFGCESVPGDCSRLLAHIKNNICSGNEVHYAYLMGWLARAVQRPDSPGEVAVVLRGRMGTGKSLFVRAFGSLFGRHFLQVSDPKHLVGSFNSHLRDCVVLFGDEAFYAGDKRHEGVLKTLITEPFITFEAKGVDAETGPNYVHLLMASNSNWVVPAGTDERRYFVLDVGDAKMQDSAYFREIAQEIENGGREAFLHTLMTLDIKDFNVRQVPQTDALREQKILSMSVEDEWWFSRLNDGHLLLEDDHWTGSAEKEVLRDEFYDYMKRLGNYRSASRTVLDSFLKKATPIGYPKTRQKKVIHRVQDPINGAPIEDVRRPYFYEFPSLAECRRHWETLFGPQDWPDVPQQMELDTNPRDDVPF